jgi:hypothetical protein
MVAQTAGDVALMILSRSYSQTHPAAANAANAAAQTNGPATGAVQETFPMLLERMKTSEFLFADSPAMRGYGTRILLQYVQNRPTSPPQVHTAFVSTRLSSVCAKIQDRGWLDRKECGRRL